MDFVKIDVLEILDQMDEFRRKHYFDKQPRPDFYMRVMEAMLAKAAGYNSRSEWTEALKNSKSRYNRDYTDMVKRRTF